MTSLPDEIWQQIFAELEDHMPLKDWILYGSHLQHKGPAALRNLSLVSRRFQRIAQPLLYRTILLEGRSEREGISQGLLLRTLVEDPQFGKQVRVASFNDCSAFTWNLDNSYKDLVEGGMKKLTLKALRALDLPPALKRHLRASFASYKVSFAALHVAFMPRLQFLDCTLTDDRSRLPWIVSGSLGLEKENLENMRSDSDTDYESDHEDGSDNDKQQLQSIPKDTFANYGLPHLTEVRLRSQISDSGVTPAWVIEPILLHPTLKSMRTLGIDWSVSEIHNLKWPNHRSNLEYLDLKESVVDHAGLESVLTRCPKLRGLSIQLVDGGREHWPDYDDWTVDLELFRRALQEYGRCLEEFDLLINGYNSMHPIDDGRIARLGPLRELSNLRHLKVTMAELLDDPTLLDEEEHLTFSEALPLSLETLYLHWDDRYFSAEYYKIRRQGINEEAHNFLLENKLPNLREITFERCYNESEKEIEWPDELKVDGWDVDVYDEYLWERYHSVGCMRTIVRLTKKF
ncbi:hypothetical protein NW762_002976 [Fusarium torreyae]|uniref:F-box domain-containing protein n=1 Tax=Fusarium torreyae TaxID=1237075 RepID=A0A9W8SDT7_9HYPO|nr:hypothetical protein NW762_002976 [Fusarium torreyae]